jgi:RNA polymerase sigma factor for flagellar operon FliA
MRAQARVFHWPFETAGTAVSPEAVETAWREYSETGSSEARDVILDRYLHLVRYMAHRLRRTMPHSIEADDLIAAGAEGLLGAVDRFDPRQGTDFAVYALTRIRGAMVDFVRGIDPVGRVTRRRLREAGRVLSTLAQDLGHAPSNAEAAERLGLSLDRYHGLRSLEAAGTTLSLDRVDDHDDGHTAPTGTRMVDLSERDPLSRVLASERARNLADLVAGLPPAQRLVLQLYYVEELNFREIAMVMDLSESRATQLHTAAVRTLRARRPVPSREDTEAEAGAYPMCGR